MILTLGILAKGEDHGPMSLPIFGIALRPGNETLRPSLPQLHFTLTF
jgi:hypothetical protein